MAAKAQVKTEDSQTDVLNMLIADGKLAVREHVAADLIGVSAGTLRNWRCDPRGNKGPAYAKIGARVVYKIDDLKAWLDSRTVPTRAVMPR